MNHNHVNYGLRLEFIHNLLKEQFSIEKTRVTPVDYSPTCPFKYNNFVYRVTLLSPNTSNNRSIQPGCVSLLLGTKELIIRLTNSSAEGMYNTTRVENEVAIISLVSSAMSHLTTKIVPEIYGWGSASAPGSQGWILQELMPGVPLSNDFGKMDLPRKVTVLNQIAEILSALQSFKLPESIKRFGGVKFDNDRLIVSARMSSVEGGPWASYEEFYREQFESALAQADKNHYIQGWRSNGVRGRLDAFIKSGLLDPFLGLTSRDERVIVHGDFTTNNMLVDTESHRITALLDYDFACISHPSQEIFRSMHDFRGQYQGWSGDEDSDQLVVREAQLRGFPSPLPKVSEDGVDWEVMKAWEDAMEKVQMKRPRTIDGIEKVADVDALLQAILPFHVTNPDKLQLQSEEDTVSHKEESEKQLVKILDHFGF